MSLTKRLLYYWAGQNDLKIILEDIHNQYRQWLDGSERDRNFVAQILVGNDARRLSRFAQSVKSDPFIPRSLRDEISDFVEGRLKVLTAARNEVLREYEGELGAGKYAKQLETNWAWLTNKILEQLYAQGCGVSQVEEEVHSIRLSIQRYLESFNPLK